MCPENWVHIIRTLVLLLQFFYSSGMSMLVNNPFHIVILHVIMAVDQGIEGIEDIIKGNLRIEGADIISGAFL